MLDFRSCPVNPDVIPLGGLNSMSYEAIVPEDDRTSFDLYRKCVGELLKCAFLKNTKLKMNLFSAAEGSALEGVNHDEFKSFLTTFRQFTLCLLYTSDAADE